MMKRLYEIIGMLTISIATMLALLLLQLIMLVTKWAQSKPYSSRPTKIRSASVGLESISYLTFAVLIPLSRSIAEVNALTASSCCFVCAATMLARACSGVTVFMPLPAESSAATPAH
jgi:hypothetical protein